VKFSLFLPPEPDARWDLARQMGVTHAVTGFPETPEGVAPWSVEALSELKARFEEAGFTLSVIEARPPMDDVMTDGPDRTAQLDAVCELLENMGEVGVPVWCSAWMAHENWVRTGTAVADRGGSLVSAYDHARTVERDPVADVAEETLWEGLETFLERAGPVAEAAGVKMAMHPDDPPLSPVRGVGRIMRSVENFERLLDLYDHPCNGITLCQGNFAAMGADVPETIRRFGDRIHFAHFRDVEGTAENFRETWHDDGPTDMAAALDAYREIGFDGTIRPDHVPTMAGEDNSDPGYHTKGRLFAIGYMRGLQHALEYAKPLDGESASRGAEAR
jgi:mannonate dehydratase